MPPNQDYSCYLWTSLFLWLSYPEQIRKKTPGQSTNWEANNLHIYLTKMSSSVTDFELIAPVDLSFPTCRLKVLQ